TKIKAMLGQSVIDAVTPSVVVLAANLEHALVLAERLPGWQLIVGAHANEDGLTPKQLQLLHEPLDPFPVGPLHKIVTPADLAEIDLSQIDVLIRADGGVGLPALSMAQLAVPDQDDVRPLLLIDLVDRHHRELYRHSRQRQEAYAERAWFAAVDPVQGR